MKQTHHLAGIVRPTVLLRPSKLSDYLNADILLAVETFQHTGSFKFRAAYNVASNVTNGHIVTASSGNFGQAMAYACKLLGKKCHIVMPANSSKTKVDAVRGYGGEVVLVDVAKISRADKVKKLSEEYPGAYVASAYDDDLVIQGNATLGVEIVASGEPIDALVVPVGGGGLSAGMVTAFKGQKVEIYGAEPALANDAVRSFRIGKIVANDQEPHTLADGARTLSLGQKNWAILEHHVADVFEISEGHIREGVKLLFRLANLKAEPTAALSIGALLSNPKDLRGRKVCCVISGGNVDPELYATLI